MNILLQKLPGHWEAVPDRPGLKFGAGTTVEEAIGSLALQNPEYFGLGTVRYDMSSELTRETVERLDLPRVVVTQSKIPIPFTF